MEGDAQAAEILQAIGDIEFIRSALDLPLHGLISVNVALVHAT